RHRALQGKHKIAVGRAKDDLEHLLSPINLVCKRSGPAVPCIRGNYLEGWALMWGCHESLHGINPPACWSQEENFLTCPRLLQSSQAEAEALVARFHASKTSDSCVAAAAMFRTSSLHRKPCASRCCARPSPTPGFWRSTRASRPHGQA